MKIRAPRKTVEDWAQAKDGQIIIVDMVEVHPQSVPPLATIGPGAELHRTLQEIGFDVSGSCQCASRIAEMNARGVDWCEANMDTILDWLAESAKAKALPFSRFIARHWVVAAIRRAKQKLANEKTGP